MIQNSAMSDIFLYLSRRKVRAECGQHPCFRFDGATLSWDFDPSDDFLYTFPVLDFVSAGVLLGPSCDCCEHQYYRLVDAALSSWGLGGRSLYTFPVLDFVSAGVLLGPGCDCCGGGGGKMRSVFFFSAHHHHQKTS